MAFLPAIAAFLLLAAGTASAQTPIPPGFDLFETDPEQTVFRFQGAASIPPGVICATCERFQGDVVFAGVPLGAFERRAVGDADTVIRRLTPASVPAGGGAAVVPIELVALSLVSLEPIAVRTQGGSQRLFDVRAGPSPSRPSRGDMRIRGNTTGGTFDSLMEVYPRFTFVPRDGQGAPGTFDTGPLGQSPAVREQVAVTQGGGVWRAGCVAPALAVPGLNDGFCRGVAPDGRKVLTIEQAALARHGVYPAQPALEHFQCYATAGRRFRARTVELADQLTRTRKRVTRTLELCVPARKNRERFSNPRAHLQCYAVTQAAAPFRVAVRNQFGPQRLQTTRARSLCVPSLKFRRTVPRGATTFTDHFQCYRLRSAPFPRRTVTLADQFGTGRARAIAPVLLCAPVQKNAGLVQHPVQHLVCYALARRAFRARGVFVRNQFGRLQPIVARFPVTLCVPSVKRRLP